jgi:hypothetical protein
LSQSLGNLELQLQREENEQMRRITNEKQSMLAKLNEIEVSLPLAENLVELRQGEVSGDVYSNQDVVYRIYLIRKTNPKGERPEVELLDSVSPGDILDVRVTMPGRTNNVSALKGSNAKGSQSLASSQWIR